MTKIFTQYDLKEIIRVEQPTCPHCSKAHTSWKLMFWRWSAVEKTDDKVIFTLRHRDDKITKDCRIWWKRQFYRITRSEILPEQPELASFTAELIS